MFTGIVADIGALEAARETAKGRRLTIRTRLADDSLMIGASVCCSGVCLTAVETGPGWFAAEAAAETLAVTTVGDWRVGRAVNIERALTLGAELGGHFVFGHVDGVGRLRARAPEGEAIRMTFEAPSALAPLLAPKGSVTIDGVSLTVNAVDGARFSVCLVPHTLAATTLGGLTEGATANLEADMLARYVARLSAFGDAKPNG